MATAVVLRGEAFRSPFSSCCTTPKKVAVSAAPQLAALDSLRTHLLEPVQRHAAGSACLFDVVVPAVYSESFSVWMKQQQNVLEHRIVNQRTTRDQMASILNTLQWAIPILSARLPGYNALVLVRVDLELKQDMPLPRPLPPSSPSLPAPVYVPFFHPVENITTPEACDVLLYLPRGRDDELLRLLSRHRGGGRTSLHSLPALMEDVRPLLAERYNSGPDFMRNPLYRIANRPERAAHLKPHPRVYQSKHADSFARQMVRTRKSLGNRYIK